jgi:hypothetical protein
VGGVDQSGDAAVAVQSGLDLSRRGGWDTGAVCGQVDCNVGGGEGHRERRVEASYDIADSNTVACNARRVCREEQVGVGGLEAREVRGFVGASRVEGYEFAVLVVDQTSGCCGLGAVNGGEGLVNIWTLDEFVGRADLIVVDDGKVWNG